MPCLAFSSSTVSMQYRSASSIGEEQRQMTCESRQRIRCPTQFQTIPKCLHVVLFSIQLPRTPPMKYSLFAEAYDTALAPALSHTTMPFVQALLTRNAAFCCYLINFICMCTLNHSSLVDHVFAISTTNSYP